MNPKCDVVVLGVTGGIACGKSVVGRYLKEMGFEVLDADHVAHDLMRKGTLVYQRIVNRFGELILADDGEISRPALGRIVFKNSVQREQLNNLVHPVVREILSEWIQHRRAGQKAAAVLIPLLFESSMEDLDWDSIICVSSCEEIILERLKQRGLEPDEARRRLDAQMPLAEKEIQAHHVLPNNGSLEELETATRNLVKAIVG